jgi:hypothetical protein
MRGDQLARHWRAIRAIEANTNEGSGAEIFRPDGAQRTAWKRSPSRAYSKNWDGLFCYWKGPKANRMFDAFFKPVLKGKTRLKRDDKWNCLYRSSRYSNRSF